MDSPWGGGVGSKASGSRRMLLAPLRLGALGRDARDRGDGGEGRGRTGGQPCAGLQQRRRTRRPHLVPHLPQGRWLGDVRVGAFHSRFVLCTCFDVEVSQPTGQAVVSMFPLPRSPKVHQQTTMSPNLSAASWNAAKRFAVILGPFQYGYPYVHFAQC